MSLAPRRKIRHRQIGLSRKASGRQRQQNEL